ncbi:hypothetical protein GCM10020331_039650 [Ectobacillus funiculus]
MHLFAAALGEAVSILISCIFPPNLSFYSHDTPFFSLHGTTEKKTELILFAHVVTIVQFGQIIPEGCFFISL